MHLRTLTLWPENGTVYLYQALCKRNISFSDSEQIDAELALADCDSDGRQLVSFVHVDWIQTSDVCIIGQLESVPCWILRMLGGYNTHCGSECSISIRLQSAFQFITQTSSPCGLMDFRQAELCVEPLKLNYLTSRPYAKLYTCLGIA